MTEQNERQVGIFALHELSHSVQVGKGVFPAVFTAAEVAELFLVENGLAVSEVVVSADDVAPVGDIAHEIKITVYIFAHSVGYL